ncbi:c-type cytochrome biogenesis protein [uncultured Ornithinimicrobium sp.]|uniref:tetratricopeptide repeat protein n=1 Tax=uncultured Ornithinimicrobium sp. TaxID=259307 RepID=UPI002593E9E1|nr:tetratricopeptide repeat protein [uncultured Ornithinimicrobium sp.]
MVQRGRTRPGALGLPPAADPHQVETTRQQVLAYLDEAPEEISAWAARQRQELTATATGPTRRRLPVPPALLALIVVPLLVWGVYKLGEVEDPQAAATPTMSTGQEAGQTPPPVDAEQVAALEARVEADPQDTAAMSELGTLHLMAGDLEEAGRWQQRILADDPDDLDARLALGVVLFNQGELTAAEEQWTAAIELAPDRAEPHYNLGFLFLSQDPPDMDRVEEHWGKVVELEPESDMAATIGTHLGQFGEDGAGATEEPQP